MSIIFYAVYLKILKIYLCCRCTCGTPTTCTCVMADMVEVAATFINDEEKYIEDGSSIKEALEVRVGND